MIVGCFVLHLYCDSPDHINHPRRHEDYKRWKANSPGEFTGGNRHQAVAAARKSGWSVNTRAMTAFCPDHKITDPIDVQLAR